MLQVRFHLGRGENYLRWQVRGPDGVRYYDPEAASLVLRGCVLVNRRAEAERVNRTQKRDVCGYVSCESVELLPASAPAGRAVHFDPKVVPYWTVEGEEGPQDRRRIDVLVSSGRRLYQPSAVYTGRRLAEAGASKEAVL